MIRRSGTQDAPITFQNYPGHTPKLRTQNAWNHIYVVSASHIIIEGFEIEGYNSIISQADAQKRYDHVAQGGTIDWNYVAQTNTNGILVRPDLYNNNPWSDEIPRNIVIRNNKVHDIPASGIQTIEADYITIENNEVFNNAWWTIYAGSGISLYNLRHVDSNANYKNYVRNNRTYNNKTFINWINNGSRSDGNGIIIDDNKNTQTDGRLNPYIGKTLVTNNISYLNGGSGIHSYSSQNVDIVNNTGYMNSSELNYGEIYASSSQNVNILNNIMYGRAGKRLNQTYGNSNVVYNYNVYFNGNTEASGGNDIWSDPKFIHAASGNFRVQIDSPAIDTGVKSLSPANDFYGNPRPRGASPDRGAIENQNIVGNPSFEWGSLTLWNLDQNSSGISVQNTGAYGGQYAAGMNTYNGGTKMSQTITAPLTKTYEVSAFINTNIPADVILGVDVGGNTINTQPSTPSGYKRVNFTFQANTGQPVKVWIQAPQYPNGWVKIDNVSIE